MMKIIKLSQICCLTCLTLIPLVVMVFVNHNKNLRLGSYEVVYALDWRKGSNYANLISISSIGGGLQIIGNGKGSLDITNNGKLLATGCVENNDICIYDIASFIDTSIYPPSDAKNAKLNQIPVPGVCAEILDDRGINSISWSPDGSRLAIVCANESISTVCILNNQDEYQCWENKYDDEIYSRVDWSPVSDEIVIDTGKQTEIFDTDDSYIIKSTGRKMKIVGIDGDKISEITDGWSPAWSPDGQEIAFFRWDEERQYAGIAITDKKGKNFRWVYRPPKRGSGGNEEYYKLSFSQTPVDLNNSSKISWSKDKKFIIVEASITDVNVNSLYHIELATNTITPVTTNISYRYDEPCLRP